MPDNLLDFLHDIYEMYEEGRAVDIIYLDFKRPSIKYHIGNC